MPRSRATFSSTVNSVCQYLCVCVCAHRGQGSVGMTSASTIRKGKDPETSNPPQAHHPPVYLSLCVANLQYTCLRPCVCAPVQPVFVAALQSALVCMRARREATSEC